MACILPTHGGISVSLPHRASRAVIVVLAVVLGLSGCSVFGVTDEEPAAVRVGDIFDGSLKLTRVVDKSTLLIPTGEVTFGVTEPLDRVDWDEWIGTEAKVPVDGAEIIAVTWKRKGVFTADVADAMTAGGAPDDPIKLWVVADGGRYEVEDVGSLGGPGERNFVFVGVPSGADLALEVEYDGVKQSVDPRTGKVTSGQAIGLYDDSLRLGDKAGGGTTCGEQKTRSGRWETSFSCKVESISSLPYAAGRGWADKGESWLILTARTDLVRAQWAIGPRRYATYTASPTRWQLALDGAGPTATLGTYQKDGTTRKQLVFEGAAVGGHRVRFTVTYALKVHAARNTGGAHPKTGVQKMVREVAIAG